MICTQCILYVLKELTYTKGIKMSKVINAVKESAKNEVRSFFNGFIFEKQVLNFLKLN